VQKGKSSKNTFDFWHLSYSDYFPHNSPNFWYDKMSFKLSFQTTNKKNYLFIKILFYVLRNITWLTMWESILNPWYIQGWWSRRLRTVQFFPKSKQTQLLSTEGKNQQNMAMSFFNKLKHFNVETKTWSHVKYFLLVNCSQTFF